MIKLIRKALFYLGLLCLIVYVISIVKIKALPDKDKILPQLYSWPKQYTIASTKFVAKSLYGDEYEVVPRYGYAIYGLVVSLHHSNSWIDISHKEWCDTLNIADFSLVYGDNLKGPYLKARYSHSDWIGYVTYSDPGFDMRGFSNNHILTDSREIEKKIMSVRPGDQILIRGFLCDYRLVKPVNKKGFLWMGKRSCKPHKTYRKTSITRDDRGDGACEIIYVKDIEILRRANVRWQSLAKFSGWGAVIFLLMSVFIYFVEPF